MDFWEYIKENLDEQWVIVWPERAIKADDGDIYYFLVGKLKVEDDFIILTTIYNEDLLIQKDIIDVISMHYDQSKLETKLRRNQIKEVKPCLDSPEIMLENE